MSIAFRMAMLAIGLVSLLGARHVWAGSLVEFSNVSERQPKLLGYLARPPGEGPFPAVVVLHGCGGFSSGGSLQIADQLQEWGYVALMVDSLTPRGLTTACGGPSIDQPGDAYAALHYLSLQSFVSAERIGVLGNSMGGYSALYAVDRALMAQYIRHVQQRFRAAVAYYPDCRVPATMMTAPALMLIGDADDWTPAERCREMVAHLRPGSVSVTLTIYPGAHHGFNFAMLQPGRSSFGHWLEYNEPAARDAKAKVQAFLAERLGTVAVDEPVAK